MLEQLLNEAKRERRNAQNARQLGTGFAVAVRYLWAVSKWMLLILLFGLLAVVWILFTVIFSPLRSK